MTRHKDHVTFQDWDTLEMQSHVSAGMSGAGIALNSVSSIVLEILTLYVALDMCKIRTNNTIILKFSKGPLDWDVKS